MSGCERSRGASRPGLANDLEPLAKRVATLTGKRLAPEEWLRRRAEPRRGAVLVAKRQRYPAGEHARTLEVIGPPLRGVMLFDNVLTTGGTMEGAQMAVKRDTGEIPVGLAVLYSVKATG